MDLPQLCRAAHLRCVEVSDRLVMLDLTAGSYDVGDEVAAAMWAELVKAPGRRDPSALAQRYGVEEAVLEADLAEFAATQLAAGRLVEQPSCTPPTRLLPRRRPSVLRAWRERASAERDLRKGFAAAYQARTAPAADERAPRAEVPRLTRRFRTAEGLYPAREAPLDCLPRSLALTRFLRTAGWPADHVIGVALYPFEAHAWVELDGEAIDEVDGYLRRFTVIQRA